MGSDLLSLEVRFLLARYGRRRVLESLARINDVSIDQLGDELAKLEMGPKPSKRAAAPDLEAVIAQLNLSSDAKASMLRELGRLYEGKLFLPNLRDVQRFVERHHHDHRRLKSRKDALPRVIAILAGFDDEQLAAVLREASRIPKESDYQRLAQQILGRDSR